MSNRRAFLCSLLGGLALLPWGGPAWGEMSMSPPDHARIVGSVPQVTFRWAGRPDRLYQVEVVSVRGVPVATQTVRQCWATITLPSGNVDYRWRLRELVGKEFREVATRAFSFSHELDYHFDGREGAAGRDGGDGVSLQVTLTRVDDFVRVQVAGPGAPLDFLLVSSSTPVSVSALGGRGGAGESGLPGHNGSLGGAPTDGMPGGPGGNGGKGGNIRVVANGVDVKKHLKLHVDGGAGGKGGSGGRGGDLPYHGQPGPDGADGKPGQPGTVTVE